MSATLAERREILRPVGLTPLLTIAQLAAYYGVSDWTVKQWASNPDFPVEPTPFRGRRFDLDRVKAWIAQNSPDAAAA